MTTEGVYYLVFIYEIMNGKKVDNERILRRSNRIIDEADPRLSYAGSFLLQEG